jgi:hypothetical protein
LPCTACGPGVNGHRELEDFATLLIPEWPRAARAQVERPSGHDGPVDLHHPIITSTNCAMGGKSALSANCIDRFALLTLQWGIQQFIVR